MTRPQKHLILLLACFFTSSANAMFWEADHSTNDPTNKYRTPQGCFAGPLIKGMRKSSKRVGKYLTEGGRPEADRGQVVNKSKKTAILLASALLGATSGYVLALATENDAQDTALTRSTLAGAGFLGGLLVGLYAIPESMNTDSQARGTPPPGLVVSFAF